MILGPVRVTGAGVVVKQYAPEVSNCMQYFNNYDKFDNIICMHVCRLELTAFFH